MPRPNLQSVIVSKDVAKTRARATKVAREYANRIYTSRETSTSWRFRQRPPTDFVKGSFRTFSIPEEDGVSLVYGELKRTDNPVTRTQIRRWERYRERAGEQTNLVDLGSLAAKGRGIFDDERMLYMFELSIADRARELGVQCGDTVDMVKLCVDDLVRGQQVSIFDNPGKRRRIPKNPKVMPDPGPCAWFGDLLEWAWDGKQGEYLWEPSRGKWLFLWSPELKAVVGIPEPRQKKRLGKVSRKAGAAKMYERFTARDAGNTYEIEIPKTKLVKLGKAVHIVYRSDKWNPGEEIDYIHEFKDGVHVYCGPSLENPKVFLCFGGKLTATERGLIY